MSIAGSIHEALRLKTHDEGLGVLKKALTNLVKNSDFHVTNALAMNID